jgi:hypothetical protein
MRRAIVVTGGRVSVHDNAPLIDVSDTYLGKILNPRSTLRRARFPSMFLDNPNERGFNPSLRRCACSSTDSFLLLPSHPTCVDGHSLNAHGALVGAKLTMREDANPLDNTRK